MKFSLNQQDLQKSLNYCQGVIEKRSTLPILSNVLLDVNNGKLTITASDLDLIFIHQISNVEILGQYRGMYYVIAGPNEMDINHYPNWPGKNRLLSVESTGANMIWFYFQNDSSIVLTKN